MHFEVYNKTYHVTDKMTHNFFNIEIKDSMLTNMDYSGNIINEKKYYLVLKLLIENRSSNNYDFDYTNFRLVLNNKNIYPTIDLGEYFIDYAKPFNKEKIKKESSNTYALVYELDKSELKNTYEIKILESLEYKVGDITPHYKIIDLKPTKITNIEDIDTYDMQKTINLKNTALGYTTFKVNNYQLTNNYVYDYPYCYTQEKCTTLKDMITPDKLGIIEKTTLLVLNIDYNLDKTTLYSETIRSDFKFFDNYLAIEYKKGDQTKILSLKNRTTDKLKNTLIFELRDEVNSAENINLLVTIRNKRYRIKLK